MKKLAIGFFDLLLAIWLLAPILPMPDPRSPISRHHLLFDPSVALASRVYNGTSDKGTVTFPGLATPGYQKIWFVFLIKASSWGTSNTLFDSVPGSSFNTSPGAFAVFPSSSFFDTQCSTWVGGDRVMYLDWTRGDNSHANLAWLPPSPGTTGVSLNQWHRIAFGLSTPGTNGAGVDSGQIAGYVDGIMQLAPAPNPCTNFNSNINTGFQAAGSTAQVMTDGGTSFQGGTIADLAIYASTDTRSGNNLGYHGKGLPTEPTCGAGAPCTADTHSDMYNLGHYDATGNFIWYPSNSHCITATPIWHNSHWGVDTGFEYSDFGGQVALTGTTKALMPPGMQPCPLD